MRATVHHASSRWARLVVTVVPSIADLPTQPQWAHAAGASVGLIRATCRAAHVYPKDSLDLARLLRTVCLGQSDQDWDLLNLLDVCHEHTFARLVHRGGLELAVRDRCAPSLSAFLGSQTFVSSAANLRALWQELQSSGFIQNSDAA